MPANNPSFQWANWMVAAYEAAQRMNPNVVVPEGLEAPVIGDMQGGWQAEGKERPVTPKICTRCQWTIKNQDQEPDKSSWCDPCKEGRYLGHAPEGVKKPVVSAFDDVVKYNKAFFGG